MHVSRRFLALVALSCSIGSGPAQADELTVLAAELPPMMTAGGEGREADVIRAVLERCGHTASFVVEPFTRHWQSFRDGAGDAVTTVPAGLDLPGSATRPYIQYQNGVSVLAERDLQIDSLDDLAGLSVIAFQGAEDILPGLAAAVPTFGSYREVADQIIQSRLLFAGRTDAVIGDGLLFAAYNAELAEAGTTQFDAGQPVTFAAIFAPSDYMLQVRDPDLAAAFDACFADAEADGTIDEIHRRYVDRYRDVLGDQYLGY